MNSIETKHLLLREWKSEDLVALIAINQDPKVMESLLKPLTEMETAALIQKMQNHFKHYGFGFFACIHKETEQCIGFVGLNVPDCDTPFIVI
jgi:RimJ/RimL family protein N-acetyltransferase